MKKSDGMVISYQVKMMKPDPEIFRYTAEKLNFLPQETLFIDDSQGNVEGAIKAGLEGYRFTTPGALRKDLQQRGIL